MKKIIEIDLCNKEDLTEKYNSKMVSGNLINYILEQSLFINKNDTVKIIINNKCNIKEDCIKIIKDGLKLEYQKKLKNRKLTNIKQFILILIGILFLFISTIIKEDFIFHEVFLIIGWVPIWEVIDIELFHDVKERRKRKVIKKLLDSDFEINSNH